MKLTKRSRLLTIGAGISAASLLVTGCTSNSFESTTEVTPRDAGTGLSVETEYSGILTSLPTSYPEVEHADLTIGYLAPNGAVELIAALTQAVEGSVEEAGGAVVALDAQAQPDLQVTQMQQLIDRDVDAIIVWPLDAQALTPVVASANEKGIPVVGIEVNPDVEGDIGLFTTQVTAGADQIGFTSAREMARIAPGADIAVAGFIVPVPYISAQTAALTKWAGEFGLNVVAEVENQTDDVAGGMDAAGGALSSHPEITGVLAYNDPTAIGAALSARESGREIIAIGSNGASDGLEAVRQGRLHATLQFPIGLWGQQLTRAAYNAVLHPDVELPKTVYPGALELVTADNIDGVLTFDEQIQALKG